MTVQRSFDWGWCPDADATGGPPNALLRADNLTWDELGIVSLRSGSARTYALGADAHSLFTSILNGTRYRLAGVANAVYANGVSIASGVAGSGDIAFGAMQNQIFFARSSTTKKYDGTTVRNWGLAMTGSTPTVAALAPDTKVFATCDQGEAPAFSADEGTRAFVTGQDGTPNGAIAVTPDVNTGRGTITKIFGSDQDFSTYAGGNAASDDDLFTVYVYITDPSNFVKLVVMVDVNSTSTNRFQDDYYQTVLTVSDTVDLTLTDQEFLSRDYTAEGRERRRVISIREDQDPLVAQIRQDKPVGNAGWNKFMVRRGRFKRTGSTSGRDWSTVKALRLITLNTVGGSSAITSWDQVQMNGSTVRPLTGRYRHRYIYVRNDGTSHAKSAPSALSAELTLQANGATVTVPQDLSRDTQTNEIWLFRMGGELDAWYRVKVQTGIVNTDAVDIQDTLSDRDALVVNVRLETDNTVPPSGIVGIAGPYYDRLLALTSTTLWSSRRLNPDSFSVGQAITIADAGETAYWIKQGLGGVFVGTSKDIYRIDGTGAELPDGSMDFQKTPLNIDHPPISQAVAQEGNLLVYLASDGWRALTGVASQLLTGHTTLLYRGKTRHGVSPVNLATGRFRAALSKGELIAITPEGASTTSSVVLYRFVFATQRWERHTYGVNWRAIIREPDGTVLASDNAGGVWTLDTGTQDEGVSVPMTLWTTEDDDGMPFQRKHPLAFRLELDSGNVAMSAALYQDGALATTLSVTANDTQIVSTDLSTLKAYRRAQLRLTGTVQTCRFLGWTLQSSPLPAMVRGRLPAANLGDPYLKTVSGVQLRLCTLAHTVGVTIYADGVAQPVIYTPITGGVPQAGISITTDIDRPDDVTLQFLTPVTGIEFYPVFDDDVELYAWTPLVTSRRPLGVTTWDSGPMDLGTPDLVWLRQVKVKVIAGADLTVTPYFDGLAHPTMTIPVNAIAANEPTVVSVWAPRGFKGKVMRLVVSSAVPFYPYWVQPVIRATSRQREKAMPQIPVRLGMEAA